MPDSPCTRAGLQPGDRFLSIDGEPVQDMTDLKLAMWDKQPGDTVTLRISRKRWLAAPRELSYSIELR
jgi:C-terminal processing protease CtpA/Prc